MGLRAPTPGAAHPRRDAHACARDGAPRPVQRGVSDQASAAAGDRPAAHAAGRSADRRDRPRRRGVRRIPARAARGISDHHPRARDRPRDRPSARRSHVQSDARSARRAQTPVSLSVDWLSVVREGGRDRAAPSARRASAHRGIHSDGRGSRTRGWGFID